MNKTIKQYIEDYISKGFTLAQARNLTAQLIILSKIEKSKFVDSVLIKGGVVMRSISGNSRRATQDLDLDFIRYSISDDAISRFIEKLNCIDGLTIRLDGKIIPLNHQDYKGKRVTISITDSEGTVISLKMDLGVHKNFSIEQDEYAFDVGFQDDAVSLLINSPAQMITEKLKSMIRFGIRNTRYKDVFDICYLCELANPDQLKVCIREFIFEDDTLRNVSTMNDVVSRIEKMFANPGYLRELRRSGKNWLDITIDEALEKDLAFFRSIQF